MTWALLAALALPAAATSTEQNGCAIDPQGRPAGGFEPPVHVGTLDGHSQIVSGLTFSPTQSHLLLSTSWDGTLKLWNLAERRLEWERRFPGVHHDAVAVSPNGKFALLAGQRNVVEMFQMQTGEPAGVYQLPDRVWAHAVAFSPDSALVIVGGTDGRTRIFERDTARVIKELRGHDWPVTQVAYSPTRQFVLSGSANKINVWSAETGTRVSTLIDKSVSDGELFWLEAFAFSPRLDWVIAGSRRMVVIFDILTGEVLQRFVGHGREVKSVAVSEDQCRLVSASADGTVRVWDIKSGQELHALEQPGRSPSAVAVSPDGRHVVTAGGWIVGDYKLDIYEFPGR